jgi:hypothetical protein
MVERQQEEDWIPLFCDSSVGESSPVVPVHAPRTSDKNGQVNFIAREGAPPPLQGQVAGPKPDDFNRLGAGLEEVILGEAEAGRLLGEGGIFLSPRFLKN